MWCVQLMIGVVGWCGGEEVGAWGVGGGWWWVRVSCGRGGLVGDGGGDLGGVGAWGRGCGWVCGGGRERGGEF